MPELITKKTKQSVAAFLKKAAQGVLLLRVSLQAIKKIALDDLAAFEAAPAGAGTFDAWLNTTTERYFRWFERLRALSRPSAPSPQVPDPPDL